MRCLSEAELPRGLVEVRTIDDSPSHEAELVIVDLVRTEAAGFLADPNRPSRNGCTGHPQVSQERPPRWSQEPHGRNGGQKRSNQDETKWSSFCTRCLLPGHLRANCQTFLRRGSCHENKRRSAGLLEESLSPHYGSERLEIAPTEPVANVSLREVRRWCHQTTRSRQVRGLRTEASLQIGDNVPSTLTIAFRARHGHSRNFLGSLQIPLDRVSGDTLSARVDLNSENLPQAIQRLFQYPNFARSRMPAEQPKTHSPLRFKLLASDQVNQLGRQIRQLLGQLTDDISVQVVFHDEMFQKKWLLTIQDIASYDNLQFTCERRMATTEIYLSAAASSRTALIPGTGSHALC